MRKHPNLPLWLAMFAGAYFSMMFDALLSGTWQMIVADLIAFAICMLIAGAVQNEYLKNK